MKTLIMEDVVRQHGRKGSFILICKCLLQEVIGFCYTIKGALSLGFLSPVVAVCYGYSVAFCL